MNFWTGLALGVVVGAAAMILAGVIATAAASTKRHTNRADTKPLQRRYDPHYWD